MEELSMAMDKQTNVVVRVCNLRAIARNSLPGMTDTRPEPRASIATKRGIILLNFNSINMVVQFLFVEFSSAKSSTFF
jgi:hypothetical protein